MVTHYLALILAIFAVNGVYGQTTRPVSMEQLLFKNILTDYDKRVRPVLDSNKTVNVSLGISLNMIKKVDERNQVLTTNIWFSQEWYDPRLSWEPALYGNFSKLRIPCDLVWLPDIVLYNSAEDQSRTYHKSQAIVKSNGIVFWSPSVLFLSSCKMDITFFPFDDQVCSLKLGSWAYDGTQLDVFQLYHKIKMNNFAKSGEWEVKGTWIEKNLVYYPCCPESYPDITFYIYLSRRPFYYTFNIIVPCMLLSLLTIFSFMLPPDSGEKVAMGLTILLAYTVFSLLVAENMPRTSEYTPLISIYLIVSMALTSSTVMFAVLVLNMHHRGITNRHPPPLLYRIMVHHIGRMVCLTQKSAEMFTHRLSAVFSNSRRSRMLAEASAASNLPANEEVDAMYVGTFVEDAEMTSSPAYDGSGNSVNNTSSNVAPNQTQSIVLSHLELMNSKQNRIEDEAACIREWQLMANVLDRALLVCYVIVLVGTNIYLLLYRPIFHKKPNLAQRS